MYKTDKIVLSVKNNAFQFLNGITANSLDKANNAFLNIHGKIIATFDQVKIGDDEYLILVEKNFVNDVLGHIDRYAKLSKTSVDQKSHLKAYFDIAGDYKAGLDEYCIPQKRGQLVITPQKFPVTTSEDEFRLFRLTNNIPVQGIDYRDEFLLNVSQVDFVSFTKGCFLGQEPVAKVHNRSKPTWKLAVRYEDELTQEEKSKMTSRMLDPDTKRCLGFIFVKND